MLPQVLVRLLGIPLELHRSSLSRVGHHGSLMRRTRAGGRAASGATIAVVRSDHDWGRVAPRAGGKVWKGHCTSSTDLPPGAPRWPGSAPANPRPGAWSRRERYGRGRRAEVGAPELTVDEAQRRDLPRHPVVNVDGSVLVTAEAPVVGAHREAPTLQRAPTRRARSAVGHGHHGSRAVTSRALRGERGLPAIIPDRPARAPRSPAPRRAGRRARRPCACPSRRG